jgi:hypothetical protein
VGDALAAGEVVLFLDGLNELGAQGVVRARQLRQWFDSPGSPARAVITCRLHDYPALDLETHTVRIQPITVERIDLATAGSLLTALVNEHSPACDEVEQHKARPPVGQSLMGQDAWEGWGSHPRSPPSCSASQPGTPRTRRLPGARSR